MVLQQIYQMQWILSNFNTKGRVYHFSYLICYPCSFYFHALMLVAHWEHKRSPLNNTGKDYKLTTDFEKILAVSLARGFDLVLSLGVTTPLVTPVLGISWPCIIGKECFDMLKGIGFGDLVRLIKLETIW